MRQRTSRPSVRVSWIRTSRAARHTASAGAATSRLWRVRTAGRGTQASRSGSGYAAAEPMEAAYPGCARRVTLVVRLMQHKTEAYWFYRVLSLVYDRWVNPLFWT